MMLWWQIFWRMLLFQLDRFLKDGGIFISSGIIYMKEEAVKEAVENNRGLKLTDVVKQGDWRAVMAEKR